MARRMSNRGLQQVMRVLSRRWRLPALVIILVMLLAGGASGGITSLVGGSDHSTLMSARTSPDELEQATVERVVDGDTIIVDLSGSRERVRLVGVNAAESVAPEAWRNTSEGRFASRHLKETLSKGDTVWLQRDVSDRDQYDRLLRYVWLEQPDDPSDEQEVRAKMLNAKLVEGGWAAAKEYPPDTRYAELFERLGQGA